MAALVLKEFVSISPGTNLVWATWQYLFQLHILTKTFWPHRAREFAACWCVWGELNVAWSWQITESGDLCGMIHALFNLSLNGKCISSLSQQKPWYPPVVLGDFSVIQKNKTLILLFFPLVAGSFLFPATFHRWKRRCMFHRWDAVLLNHSGYFYNSH